MSVSVITILSLGVFLKETYHLKYSQKSPFVITKGSKKVCILPIAFTLEGTLQLNVFAIYFILTEFLSLSNEEIFITDFLW